MNDMKGDQFPNLGSMFDKENGFDGEINRRLNAVLKIIATLGASIGITDCGEDTYDCLRKHRSDIFDIKLRL